MRVCSQRLPFHHIKCDAQQMAALHNTDQIIVLQKTPPADVAFIRATYADEDGNLSMEHEAYIGTELEVAVAAHNNGGIVIAPKPRSYRVSINKKVKKLAMFSALSAKVAEGELIVVDNIASADYKTKPMVQFLSAIGATGKTLVVLPEADKKVVKSMANIPGVATTPVNAINVYNILKYGKLVMAKDAVAKIEEVYAE